MTKGKDEIFHQLLQTLVFRNYFIAICSIAMVFATFLMNGVPLYFSHFTIFIGCATFLLYNFHIYTFQIDYTSLKSIAASFLKLPIKLHRHVFFTAISIVTIIEFFFLTKKVLLLLIPLAILSLMYSIPVWGIKRKFRIRESLFIKVPLLSAVWSLATVIIPMAEQNISMPQPLIIQQVVSRFLFVFALCIPFEIRDMEVDQKENVRTLPSVFGISKTKTLGILIMLTEIVIHHFMQIPFAAMLALDISSVFAIVWIVIKQQERNSYFYKLFVDGTMVLRFLFLYFAYTFL